MRIISRVKNKIKRIYDLVDFFAARIMSTVVDGKELWLIAEKVDEARDNGYWFYKYLREKHPTEKAYYVIFSNSPDYAKIADLGMDNIVTPYSLRHKLLFWAAEYNVSSQPQSNYFSAFIPLRNFRKKNQKTVFLQHGIIKDNLSHGIDASVAGMDMFVTSASREQQAVIERHGYTSESCILTGLCRFDNLPLEHSVKSKQILIMPTFRHWIMAANGTYATKEEKEKFVSDEFCQMYNKLLSSKRLKETLEKYDYILVFYPHYCVQPFLECFQDAKRTERVILASNKDYDVQRLLIESDMLITDFSSIFFDFAYMKKPEAFFQFDEEKYRGGHYEEGYFKYREDAFGPVLSTVEEVLRFIEERLSKECCMEDIYKKKVDTFFAYNDQNNCERTYNTIIHYKK